MSATGDSAAGGRSRSRQAGPSASTPPAGASVAPVARRAPAADQSPVYMGGVLLVLIIVFSILEPDAFPTVANFRNILIDAAVLLVMAVGMTFVMVAGGFDLSIGSVLVFSGVCRRRRRWRRWAPTTRSRSSSASSSSCLAGPGVGRRSTASASPSCGCPR